MYGFFPWGQLTSSDFLLAIRVILVFLLDRQAFPRKEKYSEQRRTLPNVLTTKVVVPSQKAPTTIMKSQNTPMTSPTATQTGTMIRRCIHRTLLMTRVLNGAVRHRAVRHNTQTSLTSNCVYVTVEALAMGDSVYFLRLRDKGRKEVLFLCTCFRHLNCLFPQSVSLEQALREVSIVVNE